MANLAPLLLLGGAALVVASARKKKKRKPSGVVIEDEPILGGKTLPPAPAPKVVSNWMHRQEALKFLADNGICDCDPGNIDGKYGAATKRAVMEFQRYAKIGVDGKWGELTEKAMLQTLRKLDNEGLPRPTPAPAPSDKEWTPADVIVMDADCAYMLHISDELFKLQRKRAAQYALEGDTTYKDAESIHQEMVEEYAPLCASLGREGVGNGVRQWWDENTKWIYNVLREYEMLPDALEQDAESFGLL